MLELLKQSFNCNDDRSNYKVLVQIATLAAHTRLKIKEAKADPQEVYLKIESEKAALTYTIRVFDDIPPGYKAVVRQTYTESTQQKPAPLHDDKQYNLMLKEEAKAWTQFLDFDVDESAIPLQFSTIENMRNRRSIIQPLAVIPIPSNCQLLDIIDAFNRCIETTKAHLTLYRDKEPKNIPYAAWLTPPQRKELKKQIENQADGTNPTKIGLVFALNRLKQFLPYLKTSEKHTAEEGITEGSSAEDYKSKKYAKYTSLSDLQKIGMCSVPFIEDNPYILTSHANIPTCTKLAINLDEIKAVAYFNQMIQSLSEHSHKLLEKELTENLNKSISIHDCLTDPTIADSQLTEQRAFAKVQKINNTVQQLHQAVTLSQKEENCETLLYHFSTTRPIFAISLLNAKSFCGRDFITLMEKHKICIDSFTDKRHFFALYTKAEICSIIALHPSRDERNLEAQKGNMTFQRWQQAHNIPTNYINYRIDSNASIQYIKRSDFFPRLWQQPYPTSTLSLRYIESAFLQFLSTSTQEILTVEALDNPQGNALLEQLDIQRVTLHKHTTKAIQTIKTIDINLNKYFDKANSWAVVSVITLLTQIHEKLPYTLSLIPQTETLIKTLFLNLSKESRNLLSNLDIIKQKSSTKENSTELESECEKQLKASLNDIYSFLTLSVPELLANLKTTIELATEIFTTFRKNLPHICQKSKKKAERDRAEKDRAALYHALLDEQNYQDIFAKLFTADDVGYLHKLTLNNEKPALYTSQFTEYSIDSLLTFLPFEKALCHLESHNHTLRFFIEIIPNFFPKTEGPNTSGLRCICELHPASLNKSSNPPPNSISIEDAYKTLLANKLKGIGSKERKCTKIIQKDNKKALNLRDICHLNLQVRSIPNSYVSLRVFNAADYSPKPSGAIKKNEILIKISQLIPNEQIRLELENLRTNQPITDLLSLIKRGENIFIDTLLEQQCKLFGENYYEDDFYLVIFCPLEGSEWFLPYLKRGNSILQMILENENNVTLSKMWERYGKEMPQIQEVKRGFTWATSLADKITCSKEIKFSGLWLEIEDSILPNIKYSNFQLR